MYGRATLDIQVCASPGRDHSLEERKTRTRSLSSSVTEEVPRSGGGREREREEGERDCLQWVTVGSEVQGERERGTASSGSQWGVRSRDTL